MQPIQSNGLILRPFEPGDADAFAAAARQSHTSVGRWMPWCHADYTADEARNWFDVCAQGFAARTSFEFGLFAEDGKELLGGAGLNHFNPDHNFCNLGYWVRQSRHRQGIALRAARALVDFGFHTLGITRIEIVVAVGNEPSDALARRLGAAFECVARNRLMIGYAPVAASVYSLVPPAA
jgi:ribosomal-protein-serine acetyltransferase